MLIPAALCVSIILRADDVMMTIMKGVLEGGEEEQQKCGYLSFSEEDVGDDVREAAAEH